MKKALLIGTVIVLGIYTGQAQITLSLNDFPSVGLSYTIYMAGDTSGAINNSIEEGVAGPADSYDISAAPSFNEDTFSISIMDASTSMWAAQHPSANMTMLANVMRDSANNITGYIHAFLMSSFSGVWNVGLTAILDTGSLVNNIPTGVFDTTHVTNDITDIVMHTTYNYGFTGTDSSHFSASIAGTYTFDERIDETIDVDGYGLLTGPYGGFDVLRIKMREIKKEAMIKGVDTLFGGIDTSYYYEYWANDVGLAVATIYMDDAWTYVTKVEYINAIPAGINDFKDSKGAKVYPNPTMGEFTLDLDDNLEASVLEVYNTIGQRVLSKSIYPGQNRVDLSDKYKGIYYVVLRDEQGNMVYASEIVKIK